LITSVTDVPEDSTKRQYAMSQTNAATRITPTAQRMPFALASASTERLGLEQEREVLEFLAHRPIHTVAMVGFIRDNGLVSALNRGTFYGCRNEHEQLEGVALIGHATLIEARTDRALEAFADVAQKCTTTHMIMGEQERIQEFWSYYSEAGQSMRLACRELLFELSWPVEVREEVPGLRLATADELGLVMPVQAQMAYDESRVNPLEKDPDGFRLRCLRRIEQGRTWVVVRDGQIIFKADIISDTPEVIYLEGVWISETDRGNGSGIRCMSQLARKLLGRTKSLCLLVNQENERSCAFYRKAGYRLRSTYDTIFLQQD
jgi:predicted GNAT family acetyltransferase